MATPNRATARLVLEEALKKNPPRVVWDGPENEWGVEQHGRWLQIIETRPLFRTIKVSDMVNEEGRRVEIQKYTHRLAMPYMQYYWSSYQGVRGRPYRVTWSLEPLESHDQLVAVPLLPNFYYSGKLCLGQFDPADLQMFCLLFWNTSFVPLEVVWYEGELEKTSLESLAHWHDLSKGASEPMEVFKGFVPPRTFTYKQLVFLDTH